MLSWSMESRGSWSIQLDCNTWMQVGELIVHYSTRNCTLLCDALSAHIQTGRHHNVVVQDETHA